MKRTAFDLFHPCLLYTSSADQAAKALENMAPQTAFVEQGTFVETVSASLSLIHI